MKESIYRFIVWSGALCLLALFLFTHFAGGAKLLTPIPGRQYTIGKLFDLINTNNPAKTSNFLVLTQKGTVSAAQFGFDQNWINAARASRVTLQKDDGQITVLINTKQLDAKTKNTYGKILLFFTVKDAKGNLLKLYLNDPWPGLPKKAGSRSINPAADILKSWDLTKTLPPD
jgi:hypothetical protein